MAKQAEQPGEEMLHFPQALKVPNKERPGPFVAVQELT
jgi:hypothetical protein